MSALRLDASAPLGLAYACLLAALAVWVWARVRGGMRGFAVVNGLVWAAAALVAVFALAQAIIERRPMFVAASDFLAVGALGILLASRLGRSDAGGDAIPLALALVALTHVLLWPPSISQESPAQATLLYALAAGLRALGAGAIVAAMPGWVAQRSSLADGREQAGLAAMGLGFALSSAWAWLNWGAAWRSDPRLNAMLAGWLLLLAGRQAGRSSGWARALKELGLAVILVGALCGDWIARGWTHLPFVAW